MVGKVFEEKAYLLRVLYGLCWLVVLGVDVILWVLQGGTWKELREHSHTLFSSSRNRLFK